MGRDFVMKSSFIIMLVLVSLVSSKLIHAEVIGDYEFTYLSCSGDLTQGEGMSPVLKRQVYSIVRPVEKNAGLVSIQGEFFSYNYEDCTINLNTYECGITKDSSVGIHVSTILTINRINGAVSELILYDKLSPFYKSSNYEGVCTCVFEVTS